MGDMLEDQWSRICYIIDIISFSLGCLVFFCLNFKQDGLACELFIFSVIFEIFLIFFRWLFKTCHKDYIVSLLAVVVFPTVEIMQVFVIVNIVSCRTSPSDFFVWLKTLVVLFGSIYRGPWITVMWTKAPSKCIKCLLSIPSCTAVFGLLHLTVFKFWIKRLIFEDLEEEFLNDIR